MRNTSMCSSRTSVADSQSRTGRPAGTISIASPERACSIAMTSLLHRVPATRPTPSATTPEPRADRISANSGFLRRRHFHRAPAEVVVVGRDPLQTPGVDAFLPLASRRNRQEAFLVVVLHLGP